jgi:toluene monooxygenase system ferredoxin subunit
MSFRAAILDSELWEGEIVGVTIDGIPVLLTRLDDKVHAYVDRCAHLGYPLSSGKLGHGILTCGAHGWQYDCRTGCGVNPKSARLEALPVDVDGDTLLVDVSAVRRRGEACARL